MEQYTILKRIFHLSKEEGYRVLKTLNYVNDKIKMRQYGDKVSFSEIAEHYKNDDLIIKVIKKHSIIDAEEYGIRIEIANHEHIFVEFEGFIKGDKYDMLIECIELAINIINRENPIDEVEFESISKILKIDTSSSDTIFTFEFCIEPSLTCNIVFDNCWLKFNFKDLEEDDEETFDVSKTNKEGD